MSSDIVRSIGQEQVPYFRTKEFSEVMLENENLIKEFAGVEKKGRVVFMTCSGTGSMEASVMNHFWSSFSTTLPNSLCSLYRNNTRIRV